MLILALAPLALLAAPQAPKATPPPGMVLIPGGQTWIGTEVADVQKAAEANATRLNTLMCETPQHQRNVESFFLAVTEVTNEQFAEFVKAANARPPDSWGLKAIEAAGTKYTTEVGQKRQEARDAGKPIPEFPKFDQVSWWNDHWREATWELPPGAETLPAGYMDFEEASAYARWAGMRLMTEFEYQRAARGTTKTEYIWGDKWDPALAAHGGLGLKSAKPVGSYPPAKASPAIFDLTGNVWEWTSSPFLPYPDFKPLEIQRRRGDKKETINSLVNWSGGQRVVVGSSFATDSPAACRIATRRPTDLDQSAEALGFRVASSAARGVDIAKGVLEDGLDQRPPTVAYDENKSVVCDRWVTAPGKSQVAGYTVIRSYDYVMFIPAIDLEFTSKDQLEKHSLAMGPVHVGAIATTKPMIHPVLPAGAYTMALRAAGPLKEHESVRSADGTVPVKPTAPTAPANGKQSIQDPEQDKDKEKEKDKKPQAPPVIYPTEFDPLQGNLLFFDKEGRAVAAVRANSDDMEFVTPRAPTATIEKGVLDLSKPGAPKQISAMAVRMKVNTWMKVPNKGIAYPLTLWFEEGVVGPDWRH